MVDNLLKLYPQLKAKADRRQQNISVPVDQRSGMDRRIEQRPTLPAPIKNDIFEVKTNVKDIYAAFKKYDNLPKTSAYMVRQQIPTKIGLLEDNKELLNLALSPIPMARRLVNIENNKDDNKLKAVGIGMIGLINIKEDIRDLMSIFGKTKSHNADGCYAKYGFLVGTSIEEKLQRTKWGKYILRKIDSTIGESKLGTKFLEKIRVKANAFTGKKEIEHLSGVKETVLRKYVGFTGPKIGQLIGLTLYRIPKLSLLAAAILEIPSILKSKRNSKLKQTTNSTLNVIVGIGCGALCSALLAPIHPGLPVMGLGIGYYIGSRISKALGFNLNTNV